MDTLLFNDPEVKGLAFAILEECRPGRAFGRRMLELLANAAMSAKADEARATPLRERDERVNSRNGYRERELLDRRGRRRPQDSAVLLRLILPLAPDRAPLQGG